MDKNIFKHSPETHIKDTFIREVRANYRRTKTAATVMNSPEVVAAFARRVLVDNSREHVVALFLDASHAVASYSIIAIGTTNSCPAHPREIFQRAVLVGAIAVILIHNHPSGCLTPSAADIEVTKRIQDAGEILNIKLLDHLIINDSDFRSLVNH